MSAEDLDNYETDAELALYREYRDVIKLFTYVVETERRFYLANKVDFNVRSAGQDVYFDVQLTDAWVWDVYRSSRFVKSVRIVTFKDVNVEEVQKTDIDIPADIHLSGVAPRQSPIHRLCDHGLPGRHLIRVSCSIHAHTILMARPGLGPVFFR